MGAAFGVDLGADLISHTYSAIWPRNYPRRPRMHTKKKGSNEKTLPFGICRFAGALRDIHVFIAGGCPCPFRTIRLCGSQSAERQNVDFEPRVADAGPRPVCDLMRPRPCEG